MRHVREVDVTARSDHRAKVRATLAKIDGGMLAWMDAMKSTFDAKANGVHAVQDGELRGMGRLSTYSAAEGRDAGEWPTWTYGDGR